jgi:FAD-dependent urate hydroxylase
VRPLDRLADAARREWAMLAYPANPWVDGMAGPDGATALDCAIIGAGQFGLATATTLRRERIERVICFDAAPEGEEGPWVSFARMQMLRTPKHITGPDLGLPSLTFQSWWEAQHGTAAWEALFRIPRTAWMEYLVWYRHTLDLPVRNGWKLVSLAPAGDALLRLGFETAAGPRTLFARNVVLAMGASGADPGDLPAVMQGLPEGRALHANTRFDLASLRGARVAVLGAGASGFDMAIAALEAGACEASVSVRRASLPRRNPRRWMESAGYLAHYPDLPDATKWATSVHLDVIGQPPPLPTYERALSLPGFRLLTGFPWDSCRWTGAEIEITGGGRRLHADVVVAATGMRFAMEEVPALAPIAAQMARWADRLPGADNPALAVAPYLTPEACFQERMPGAAPWLRRIATCMAGAALSLGPTATSNSGLKFVVPRLVQGVRRRLFLDQQEADWARFTADTHHELPEDDAA